MAGELISGMANGDWLSPRHDEIDPDRIADAIESDPTAGAVEVRDAELPRREEYPAGAEGGSHWAKAVDRATLVRQGSKRR